MSAPRIEPGSRAMSELIDGLGNAAAEHPLAMSLSGERAALAWERDVIDPAIAEIAPTVAQLLDEAIARRLPWEAPPASVSPLRP